MEINKAPFSTATPDEEYARMSVTANEAAARAKEASEQAPAPLGQTTADEDFKRAEAQAKRGEVKSTPVFNGTTDDTRYAGYERYPSKR